MLVLEQDYVLRELNEMGARQHTLGLNTVRMRFVAGYCGRRENG